MSQVIECVPNFSEGRDAAVIQAIADAIASVDGVSLLNVDPGKSTNRTVYTFAGPPELVCEAAVRAARVGSVLIDMSIHTGEHPRFGAMDVCPLVPISGITMDETVVYARALGKRLAEEIGLTVYLYGEAARLDDRKSLATVRAGEYEGLAERLKKQEWAPDFGPAAFNSKSGASAVGARDFLIAYNVNLNTTSVRRANSVAFDVREKGRVKRIGDPINGEIVRDQEGNPIHEPGTLKGVRAIGWFIEEYGFAQVSMNLTSITETPLHLAFDECERKANERGIRVTGSEVIGLVPLSAMTEAGKYFLRKQCRSVGVSEAELVRVAVKTMGLDELAPFDPEERIIEWALTGKPRPQAKSYRSNGPLMALPTQGFIEEVASESPAPGGGSVAALAGALGAALATMVANLSSHKRGWDDKWEEFSDWAERGQAVVAELSRLVDEDTRAFDKIMAAFGLPQGSEDEKTARSVAIQSATKVAIEVPLSTMRASLNALQIAKAMAEIGNPNSISDAGVGALCARAAIRGAYLNVKINCGSLKDKSFVEQKLNEASQIVEQAQILEEETIAVCESKM